MMMTMKSIGRDNHGAIVHNQRSMRGLVFLSIPATGGILGETAYYDALV
jgi:hypothetical protein